MKMSLKKIIKKNEGFTGADLSISLIVILISIGVIATMFYNIYFAGAGMKRNVIATDYAINVLETVQITDYSKVTFNEEDDENLELKNELDKLLKVNGTCENNLYTARANNFDIEIKIEKYNEKAGNEEKEDYIKIVKVKVKYNLGKKADKSANTEILEISTLKTIK